MGKELAGRKSLMVRLRFIVEGQTERRFVETVLAPHLAGFGVYAERPQVVCTSRDRRTGVKRIGGMTSWARVFGEIVRLLKSDRDPNCRFTTMFDYYALPADFPGRSENVMSTPAEAVAEIELAMGEGLVDTRLIPYVQMHEFEALVFADVCQLESEYFNHGKAVEDLMRQAEAFDCPEMIDGGYQNRRVVFAKLMN